MDWMGRRKFCIYFASQLSRSFSPAHPFDILQNMLHRLVTVRWFPYQMSLIEGVAYIFGSRNTSPFHSSRNLLLARFLLTQPEIL